VMLKSILSFNLKAELKAQHHYLSGAACD